MKPGRIILAIVFFIFFIICFYLLVNGWRTYDYEAVFPEDVNVVIHLHGPADVPLKILDSTVATRFFRTKKGRQMLDTINAALAAEGEDGGEAATAIYRETLEGVNVYYLGSPARKAEGAPKAKKGKAPRLDLEQLKRGLTIGGAIVKDIYLAIYGNPTDMKNRMDGEDVPAPNWMAAVDLGRLTAVPRAILPGKAKPLKKLPEGEKPKVAFAFIRNMAVMGDPDGVKRMIHVAHGTPMKAEVTEKGRWVEARKAWEVEEADFRLTLLAPNLMDKLQSDPTIKEEVGEIAKKYGLDKLQAFVLSSESGKNGLTLRMNLLSEKGRQFPRRCGNKLR